MRLSCLEQIYTIRQNILIYKFHLSLQLIQKNAGIYQYHCKYSHKYFFFQKITYLIKLTEQNMNSPTTHPFRQNRFNQDQRTLFRQKSPSQFDMRPMSPLYGIQSNLKSQSKPFEFLKPPTININNQNTIIRQPAQFINQPLYTIDSNVPYQNIQKPQSFVLHSPPSHLRYSPPHATKTILNNSRVIMPPTTTTILPQNTITSIPTQFIPKTTYITHPPIIHQTNPIQIPYQNITHVQTIRQTSNQDSSQINKLKAMNQFLSENYTLVYNKLKQLQNEKSEYKGSFETESINQVTFMRMTVNRIQQIYESQLENGLSRLRAITPKIQVYKSIRVGM